PRRTRGSSRTAAPCAGGGPVSAASGPTGRPHRRRRAAKARPARPAYLPATTAAPGSASASCCVGAPYPEARGERSSTLPLPGLSEHRRTGGSGLLAPQLAPDPPQRVVVAVRDALLQGDDCVVGDVDVFGADFGAALGDVAVANACL